MKIQEILQEFAPGQSANNGGGDEDEENILRSYAARWYNGSAGRRREVETVLKLQGWDIGEIESEEGGAFVVRVGDINGNSYIGWTADDLESDLNENTGMKIQEVLQEESPLPPEALRQFRAWGFRPRGSGSFKQVFYDDSGHALIVQPVDELHHEKSFINWVKFCQQHPNHPHLPNFGGLRRVTIAGEEYVVTRAERLRPINPRQTTTILDEVLTALIQVATSKEQKPYESVPDYLRGRYFQDSPEQTEAQVAFFQKTDFRSLFDTIRMVYQAGKRLKEWDDMRHDNFMIASNGRIVINDPWQ